MRLKTLLAACAAASLSSIVVAQTAPQFGPDRFRSHVAFLADDLLEGRDAGTRGYDIAARYVATRFQGLGLRQPAGGWYQQVPFVEYGLADAPASLTIGGKAFADRGDVLIGASPVAAPTSIEAPVVFVGYGLDAPSAGFDDYAGLDVKGKIVTVLGGVPEGTPSDLAAHLSNQKKVMAGKRGAVGFITLPAKDSSASWQWAVSHAGKPSLTWVAPDGRPYMSAPEVGFSASLNTPAAEALFEGAPRSLAEVQAEAARPGSEPKGFALRPSVRIDRQIKTSRMASPNVVAVLPGSDPALANEYVLLMAHLDHTGVREGGSGDRINNGAMDNATGVATLLEVARAFAESGTRPRRPILFAAVTAEEDGLLGAQYLAKNPVVDGKVVSVVNLDMPVLLYDFTDVIAFGSEHSTLGPIVERAGARMGVKLIDDPLPEQGLFTRSDHYRFVQEGVPSVFLMTGFGNGGEKQFRNFLSTHYHQPSDDLRLPIDWQAGAKFARINYLIANEIANADQAPRWYQGSFFGETLAPGQPKATKPAS